MEGWEESKMGQKLNVLLMYFIDAPAAMCGQKIFSLFTAHVCTLLCIGYT